MNYTPLIPVDSTALRAVGYEGGALLVLFWTSDTIYHHPGVPYSLFVNLLNATSKGTFYNQQIRGKYR